MISQVGTYHTKMYISAKKNHELDLNFIPYSGKHVGNGWKIAYHYEDEEPYHSGYFYGPINDQEVISGTDVTFVYPDFNTVLIGEFDNGTMIEAIEGNIVAYRCTDEILHIKTKAKTDSPVYKFDPPTTLKISSNPTLRDPLEQKTYYLREGDFGDSLFAKKDFVKGDLISYYNGIWYKKDNVNWDNMTDDEQ